MNFLYRNRSAAKVPKIDHWQYQQNVLDAKMNQCHQNVLDARIADNYQGILGLMSELEMIVEKQRRRLNEVPPAVGQLEAAAEAPGVGMDMEKSL
jgi:hypothetical protein